MNASVLPTSRWYSLLIHTDASLSDNIVGIGYTIRVNQETHENATYVEGDYTSMEAEFLALKEAAKVVAEFFDAKEHVFFYTDCKGLAKKLEDPDGKWAERVQKLKSILHRDWSVKWIPRERNNKADSLAHVGRDRARSTA
jgi:ribonuclease HI